MQPVRPGDRIKLVLMPNDQHPIEPGSEGTVVAVTGGAYAQIDVNWDSGRSLCLIPGVDQFEVTARWHEMLKPNPNGTDKDSRKV